MTEQSTILSSARPKSKSAKITVGILSAALLATLVPSITANAAEPSYVLGSTVLNDSMSRTVSQSWGKATSTIAYLGSNSALSVASGTARMSLPTPGHSMTTEASVKAVNAEGSFKFSIDKLPTKGNGVYTSLQLRHTSTGFYRTVLQVTPAGKTYLEISRSNGNKITVLKTIPLSLVVKSGQSVNLKLRTAGTSSVDLSAKAWLDGTAEPANWSATFTDTNSAKITTTGTLAISAYLAGGSQASALKFDDVKLSTVVEKPVTVPTTPKPTVTATPTPTAPATATPSKPAQTNANLPGWGEPAFRDEFNTDTKQWNVRNNDSLSYDVARIKAANVTVSDGLLHIAGKKETVDGRDFTSGYLDSIGKFEQQYGRWEVRAKIPTTPGDSRGIWPAFWLRNQGVGEMDIMEAWGDPFDKPTKIGTSSLTVHESTNGTGASKGWNWETLAGATANSSEAFHTWAIEYTPTSLKAYFDNKLVMTATKADYPWLWGANFQTKFNMRLNLQIGSPYHGNPVGPNYVDTKSYSDFQIDYVRAWAYKG